MHISDQDQGDVGDGVNVVLGVVGEAGAGHEVEVFEDGVEAFADAVVEFADGGVAVDEQDGVVGANWDMGVKRRGGLFIAISKSSSYLKGELLVPLGLRNPIANDGQRQANFRQRFG